MNPSMLTAAALASFCVSLAAVGCGPSFAALHEGEARFEHCYALEETSASLDKKAECWRDWTKNHTYGQTRDRVQYAVQRYEALSRVPGLPTDEAMMSAAPGEGVTSSHITAPAPTSAFAPPPKTMVLSSDGGALEAGSMVGNLPNASPVEAANAPVRPAVATCLDECESTWKTCRSGCAGKKCDECEKSHRACLRRCVK